MDAEDATQERRIRIDSPGGVAGDMFVAAAIDARPELAEGIDAAIAALPLPEGASWRIEAGADGGLTGRRFHTVLPAKADHSHRRYSEIRALIAGAALGARVRDRALDIYRLLAEAEAEMHGESVEEIAFHEVGAWDSIIDVVAAAAAIEGLDAACWYCGPLPLGHGRVSTAHGELAVPAPAVAHLLRGFDLHDDGRAGERVTPTGAAILRHLACRTDTRTFGGRLLGTGTGFGTRRLEGLPNALRLLVLEGPRDRGAAREALTHIAFEIDDQSAEDLGIGLDRIRALEGVRDVVQMPVYAKKGRLAIRVEVLVLPDRAENAIAACLSETSTLGVRVHDLERVTLDRTTRTVASKWGEARLKAAVRPDGQCTAKPEMEDVARLTQGYADREAFRRAVATPPDDAGEGES